MKASAKAALAMAALLSSTYGAFAHAHLRTQMPAADARLSAAPASLVLGFSEGLEIGLSGIALKGPDGKAVATGAATLVPGDDKQMSVNLTGSLPAGAYTVEWHVLSKDGHTTQGSYRFSVGQ